MVRPSRDDATLCRECGRDLCKVAPRYWTRINPKAKVVKGKHLRPLLGYYCSSDCALTAIDRGIPRHH